MKNNVIKLSYFILGVFLILIVYLAYLQVYEGSFLANHPKNPRVIAKEQEILRGKIIDRQGAILAESFSEKGQIIRNYPYGEVFAHVVGYTSTMGVKTGLEAANDKYLLGLQEDQRLRNYLDKLQGKPPVGLNIVTTLDADLQVLAYNLLKGKKGSIVALKPGTNEVLVMVSSPTFDPNNLQRNWEQLNTDESQKPLLNRATQGLYPPGSILKVMTGAGILEKNPDFDEFVDCPGYIQVGNYRLKDLSVHGKVNFSEALKVSCNTTFAYYGLELGSQEFYDLAINFGFLKDLDFDLGVKQSYLPKPSEIGKEDLAQSAIGQGKILVSPLHMALLAATVANNGKMVNPHLTDRIITENDVTIKSRSGDKGQQIISEATVTRLKEAMVKVVAEGTGKKARIAGIDVAGKTGSAENPHGEPHSWFIGFAPADNPQIVVSVIVENGGLGGGEGTTIAKAMIEKALKN